MKNILFLLPGALFLSGCVLNLVTGRKQLSLVPESELQLMAAGQYQTFLSENKVLSPGSSNEAAMVDRVGAHISKAISKYYISRQQESVIDGYKWEFNTIDNEAVNAWCMPGALKFYTASH